MANRTKRHNAFALVTRCHFGEKWRRVKTLRWLLVLIFFTRITAVARADDPRYEIRGSEQGQWLLAGTFDGPIDNVGRGSDRLGDYVEMTAHFIRDKTPLTEQVKFYKQRSIALFSLTYEAAARKPVAAFPDFTDLPASFHVMSFREHEFSPPEFAPLASGGPWLIFNDQDQAFIVSPASHFPVQRVGGDAQTHIRGEFREELKDIPAGFTQQTLVAFGPGINATWDIWGDAMTELQGKTRPASDADVGLKYLGYWTDNGTHYYYNYDPTLGYGGTLLALEKHFQADNIPVHYMQLDSWWYLKTLTSYDGKVGKTKNPRLAEGQWNRYGGLLEYRADPAVFPHGLNGFDHALRLPLITHNRWIDPQSPYHRSYRITGLAAIDPKWWQDILSYVNNAGTITYEQDWLVQIQRHSPDFASTTSAGDQFFDDMAAAAADHGMTLQYCMATPSDFLQGSKYSNLTSIRTSDDRFRRDRWHDFVFTSRLASALGIWPWTDAYLTSETGNVLLSDLSAGMVGFGDEMGQEDKQNIFRAVRSDGVIVKPDVPIVPLDCSYIDQAEGKKTALLAGTFTDHEGVRTMYVVAFAVPSRPPPGGLSDREAPPAKNAVRDVEFSLDQIGVRGPAYVYDYFNQSARFLRPAESVRDDLGADGFKYYIIAQPGKSGIAFFGDMGKFVSTGKQRIASIKDEAGKMTVTVAFAPGDSEVKLHGCCPAPPTASIDGNPLEVTYDLQSGHFSFVVRAASQPDVTVVIENR